MHRSILLPVWIFQFYTILSGLQPSSAQSQTDPSYNNWIIGIETGVLTAPGHTLVRRHLPPIIGIVAEKQISAISSIIAEAHYSLWRETLAFTDWYDCYGPLFPSFRDPFCNPESIEYPRPPKAIRLHSFRLNLGYETSAASVLKLPVFVGGKVGLRFYKERWEYLAMMEYFKYRPPGSYSSEVPPLQPIRYTERSESQITVSLFGGLRFGDPNRGQRIYMEYSIPHELLQWISGDAPSQSTDEGFRIMLVYPVLTHSGNREIQNETAGTKDIGSINLIIGKAGFSRGVSTQPGNSMYGFQLSRIISPRVFLDAEMSTIYWRDSRPRNIHILRDYELGLWWDRLTVDGRVWEFSVGPTVSVLGGSGPQLSVGVSAGIRRQREFWDYDTKGWNLSLFWDAPPDNPGVQVDGLLGLKLVLALSKSPTSMRAQIGFSDKMWKITSGEPRSLIDTSGYRFAFLIPLGGL